MAKSKANAPVVKKSDLARSIPTRPLTDAEIKAHSDKHAAEVRAIVEGRTPKPARLRNDDEHTGQALFFQIELPKLIAKYGGQLDDMFAIPNFSMGHKSEHVRKMMGQRAKLEGRKKGVFDICYPNARGAWHSLWLEAKVDAQPSDEQRAFQMRRLHSECLALFVKRETAQSLALALANIVEMYECSGPYRAPTRYRHEEDNLFALQRLLSCQVE